MNVEWWAIAIGVAAPLVAAALTALVVWMFAAHGRLATLTEKVDELAENHIAELARKLDKLIDSDRRLLEMCAGHAVAIEELRRRLCIDLD